MKKETGQTSSSVGLRSSSFVLPSDHRASEEPLLHTNFARHLGPAVKQLTPANLPTQLTVDKTSNNTMSPPVQLKRSLGTHQKKVWENWWATCNMGGRVALAAVLGCCFFATCKLQFGGMRSPSTWNSTESKMTPSTLAWSLDWRLGKLLGMIKNPLKYPPDARTMENSWPLDDPSSITKASAGSMNVLHKRQMPLEEAETLVKEWQAIKAEALGPNHQLHNLSEVLSESMLAQVIIECSYECSFIYLFIHFFAGIGNKINFIQYMSLYFLASFNMIPVTIEKKKDKFYSPKRRVSAPKHTKVFYWSNIQNSS